MAKRDEAALKLLRWELQGYGKIVMEAMLRHPDKNLAEAVDLIEQEVPDLSPSDPHSEMPAPVAARPRASSELDALGRSSRRSGTSSTRRRRKRWRGPFERSPAPRTGGRWSPSAQRSGP